MILCHDSEADPVPPEQNLPSLVAILKVPRLWQIDNSIAWAITHLNALNLTPVKKLELAHKYVIPQWIAPCHNPVTPQNPIPI